MVWLWLLSSRHLCSFPKPFSCTKTACLAPIFSQKHKKLERTKLLPLFRSPFSREHAGIARHAHARPSRRFFHQKVFILLMFVLISWNKVYLWLRNHERESINYRGASWVGGKATHGLSDWARVLIAVQTWLNVIGNSQHVDIGRVASGYGAVYLFHRSLTTVRHVHQTHNLSSLP